MNIKMRESGKVRVKIILPKTPKETERRGGGEGIKAQKFITPSPLTNFQKEVKDAING